MTIIFDGKQFAKQKEIILKEKLRSLKIKPKLVSILVGNNSASLLYTKLKKAEATRIGITFEVKKLKEDEIAENIIDLIKKLNSDKKVNGIMVRSEERR